MPSASKALFGLPRSGARSTMTTISSTIRYVAGADGGGTKCRVRVRRRDGSLVGEGLGGRANLYASVPDAVESIKAAMAAAFAAAGLSNVDSAEIACGLGLAGASVREAVDALKERLPYGRIAVTTDGAAALAGAFRGGDGAIAILGTGAAYLARRGDLLHEVGGWGFHAGDQGSGADLGRMALRYSLLAHDGVLASSAMTEAVLARFGGDPMRLIAFARDASPAEYGALAPLVADNAETGDVNALHCLEEALNVIRASLRKVTAGGGRLCLLGGLAARYRPHLEAEFSELLAEPQADAMEGALLLAMESLAAETGTKVVA
jgi:glucosamine kinase